MFDFKVIARSFPAICVVAGAFLFFLGESVAGGLLILLAFISYVLVLIANKV